MPTVALIRPLYEGDESEFQEPLGIERLAGFLKANTDEEVRLFDRRLYQQERLFGLADENSFSFWDDFTRAFPVTAPPDIIGLSVMTAEDVPDSLRLISRLKTFYPRAHFIVGGLFVTTALDSAQRRFPAEVQLVSCEGEIPLLETFRAVMAEGVVKTPRFESEKCDAERFDARSLPDKSDSPKDIHLTPDGWAIASRPDLERYLALGCAISLQSSRGCHGSCSFCATPKLPSPYRRWQGRSLPLVVDEIALLSAHAAESGLLPIFNFVDDDFGPLSRIEALDLELKRRGLRIAYALQLRAADLLEQDRLPERLAELRKGGFTRVFLGVESLCPQTLEDWNKSYATDKLPEVFSALKKAGISAHIGYILWHSGTSVEDARIEAKRLWEMGLYCPKVAESRMVLFPGSRLHERGLAAKQVSHAACWEPMSAESERFYQQLSNKLRPVYDAWKEGAVLSPWLAAQAHLTGERTLIEALDAVLAECDRISYRSFVHDEFPQDLHRIAAKLSQRITQIRQTALPMRNRPSKQSADNPSANRPASRSSRRREQ
ncbi:MAG: radical SAM protein [Coriobacteriaceae bacterium]|nr:radical SAM protein [Coriobacteriaceae bacterium]